MPSTPSPINLSPSTPLTPSTPAPSYASAIASIASSHTLQAAPSIRVNPKKHPTIVADDPLSAFAIEKSVARRPQETASSTHTSAISRSSSPATTEGPHTPSPIGQHASETRGAALDHAKDRIGALFHVQDSNMLEG